MSISYPFLMISLVFVAMMLPVLGCHSERPESPDVPRTVLRLPAVAPRSDIESLDAVPASKSVLAGETILVQGEYDTRAIPTPPKAVTVEIGETRRGQWRVMGMGLTKEAKEGKYSTSVEIPEKPGDIELRVRTREEAIGRFRLTIVDPEAAAATASE